MIVEFFIICTLFSMIFIIIFSVIMLINIEKLFTQIRYLDNKINEIELKFMLENYNKLKG